MSEEKQNVRCRIWDILYILYYVFKFAFFFLLFNKTLENENIFLNHEGMERETGGRI